MTGKLEFAVLKSFKACKYNYISSIKKMDIYVFIKHDSIKQE